MRSFGQIDDPSAQSILFRLGGADHRSCTMHQERLHVRIAPPADAQQALFPARTVWRGVNPSEAAS
jgi:hypothetical protein